ncbi:hypothetical protein SAMN04488561_0370 [Jiangella alba]|uniref:Uncharacterized protein n=1 Tax=Jiangella alba TaxID=561176 RepID=A0A1H5DD50_9ACTN|nr:hypothetical protein SAMN04488561_0370 [Jiangella alba]
MYSRSSSGNACHAPLFAPVRCDDAEPAASVSARSPRFAAQRAALPRTLPTPSPRSPHAATAPRPHLAHASLAPTRPPPLPAPRSPLPAPRSPLPAPRSPLPAPRSPLPAPRSPLPAPRSPLPAPRLSSQPHSCPPLAGHARTALPACRFPRSLARALRSPATPAPRSLPAASLATSPAPSARRPRPHRAPCLPLPAQPRPRFRSPVTPAPPLASHASLTPPCTPSPTMPTARSLPCRFPRRPASCLRRQGGCRQSARKSSGRSTPLIPLMRSPSSAPGRSPPGNHPEHRHRRHHSRVRHQARLAAVRQEITQNIDTGDPAHAFAGKRAWRQSARKSSGRSTPSTPSDSRASRTTRKARPAG